MFKILVVEDDTKLREGIIMSLKNNGYNAIGAENGKRALEVLDNSHMDLIITDVMMPIMDGVELTKKIKSNNMNMPILMLTALDTIEDKEVGFNSGADDYLVKPFSIKELNLRINALLRRYSKTYEKEITIGKTKLDYKSATIYIDDNKLELTKKEFQLLFKLASSPNVIYSREDLINEIWGYDCESNDRTIDTHIKFIREKVKTNDFYIETVRGLGYRVKINEDNK